MSNRSYPSGFQRPIRETPVANDADVQRMLARLRRRCKVGKVSVNDSSAQRTEDQPQGNTPSNVSAVLNLAPASSAGHPSPASASVVSGAAGITATAGGGPHEAVPSSPPFQPTRPAPILGDGVSALRTVDAPEPGSVGSPQPTRSASDIASGPAGQEAGEVLGVPPAGKTPSLQWERISPTAMRTTCGTWTCCRITIGGIHSYELWRRLAGMERSIPVPPSFSSFDQARQAAQDEMEIDNGS